MSTLPPLGTGPLGQNDGMDALPPPVAPPSVPPPPAPPRTPPGSPRSGFDDLDWDRIQSLARRWYAPLAERHTWMAALYLFVGIFSAVAFFIVLNVIGWTTVGLLFVGVGILLVKPFFLAVEALCRAERAMAQWVGVAIPPRPMAPLNRLGLNALSDAERWRQVGYLALNVVIGTVIGTAGTSAYFAAPSFVFDGPFDTRVLFGLGPILWVLGVAFGAFMLGAAPRIAVFAGRLKAQITAWFLGPDQLAEARQRVDTLATQRQDILDAVASERRRIERNLHDGVQQQLVAIGLDLGMAEHHLDRDPEAVRQLLVSARQKVQGSIGELRQLGRGLHPAILADRGVDAALSAVVANAPIPISVVVDPDLGLTTDTAETVYFVANEAIANVLKHAHARVASVHVTRLDDRVRVTVHDDGNGGVDASKGTGIAGIRARVHAVDGTFSVTSPVGGPTTLVAEIPRHDRSRHE